MIRRNRAVEHDWDETLDEGLSFGQRFASLEEIFEEEPVDLTTFVRGRQFLNSPRLSPLQYDVVRHLEQIFPVEVYTKMRDEMDPYWNPVRKVTEAWVEMGKGCLAADQEVYDATTGLWTPIADLLETKTATIDKYGAVRANSVPVGKRGIGRTLRVTMNSGAVVTGYEKHVLATQHGWKKLDELQVGDYVTQVRVIPEPAQPVDMPDHIASIIGFWLGDGVMPTDSPKSSVRMLFGEKEPEALARYLQDIDKLDCYGSVDYKEDRHYYVIVGRIKPKGKLTPKELAAKRASGEPIKKGRPTNPLKDLARETGLMGKVALTKRVPQAVFQLPQETLRTFMISLWGTDGNVYVPKNEGSGRPCISYTSICEGLVRDVHKLLLRFGIHSSIRRKVTNGGVGFAWSCDIRTGADMQQFCTWFRLYSKHEKQDELLAWIDSRKDNNQGWGSRSQEGEWQPFHSVKIKSIEEVPDQPYYDLTTEHESASYIACDGLIHHNSGKDYMCQVATMRVAYLLNCLNDPPKFYGLPSQSFIHLLNVAANANQALTVFFESVKKSAQRGWFADKCTVGRNSVQWNKNVLQISGHSQTESQEGLNLLMGVCDEIDAFPIPDAARTASGKAQDSSDSIVKMIRSSGSTRFPGDYKLAVISYPRYVGSPIHKGRRNAARKSQSSNSFFYAAPSDPKRDGYATWEVNPLRTRANFDHEYEADPVEAAAKYECKPARAMRPFIGNMPLLQKSRDVGRHNPIEVTYRCVDDVYDADFHISDKFVPIEGAAYAMHADLAIVGDRAGLAMSHLKDWTTVESKFWDLDENGNEYEESQWDYFPSFITDFAIGFESDISSSPPREIQIDWYRQLLVKLQQRGFPIMLATADGFQSASTLQLIERRGVETDKFSMDISKDGYLNLRDLIYDERVSLPDDDLLFVELESLEDVGKKIDHTPASTKDISDAVGGSLVGALRVGGREDEDHTIRTPSTTGTLYTPPPPAEFALLGGSDTLDLL